MRGRAGASHFAGEAVGLGVAARRGPARLQHRSSAVKTVEDLEV